MKISARNVLKGKVKQLTEEGAVNTEVVVELAGGGSGLHHHQGGAESLGLAVGKEIFAIIKASSVMIAVD